jgi:hypothetical protein
LTFWVKPLMQMYKTKSIGGIIISRFYYVGGIWGDMSMRQKLEIIWECPTLPLGPIRQSSRWKHGKPRYFDTWFQMMLPDLPLTQWANISWSFHGVPRWPDPPSEGGITPRWPGGLGAWKLPALGAFTCVCIKLEGGTGRTCT